MSSFVTIPPLAVDLAFAESYFSNRLHADAWGAASETDKAKALSWAASIIQNAFIWQEGEAYSETEWAVPVLYAVCEEAFWLLKIDPTDYPAVLTKGLISGNAGSVSGTFSKEMVAPLVCKAAISLIGILGTLNDDEAGTVVSTMLGG